MMSFTTPWAGTAGRIGILTLAVAAAGALSSAPAAAQQRQDRIPLTEFILNEATGQMERLNTQRGGFNLFAEEDLAGTSLRLSGGYRYPPINAGGLCPFANTAGDIFNTQCGVYNGTSTYFQITPVWGIGPVDYAKIREVHPAVATMQLPLGYSTPWRISSVAPVIIRINAADAQFGRLFAGVTSANGEGCRDFQGVAGAGLPANFTLTASLECPPTWASGGYDGIRAVPDSVWLQRFQADPANFTWADYKIPQAERETYSYLGTNSTYGAFSDFPREVLVKAGGVTPRGSGPPQDRGFPLGIEVRYDSWKFDRPSLRDGAFVRWLVINNSEKVWGRGIDYDAIYMGLDPGPSAFGQAPAGTNDVSKGYHVIHGGNWSGLCNTTTYPRRVPPGANVGCDTNARTTDFRFIMVLKSPLGDLRYKQFSDPTSPYYNPTSPLADDTITFNHWRRGGFGQAQAQSYRRNDKSTYGWIAGDEEAWFDGRSSTDFTAAQIWNFFLYEGTDGTNQQSNARFNRFVPGDTPGYGTWDYNNDGIQDTIKVPDCGVAGCAKPWSDTIAGGFSNEIVGNLGNFMGFGPFALAAGDTTEVVWYLGGTPGDTLFFQRTIDNITKAYLANYAGASAYPVPTIAPENITVNSAWLRDSTAGNQNTEVRIQIKMPPRQDDPFLADVLRRLESPEGAEIRRLNPGIVNTVRGRMRQNLAEVMVFKSCDNGVTWTHLADCVYTPAQGIGDDSRARDEQGGIIGMGWRPRGRFTVSGADTVTGNLSGYVFSETVQAGRTYLYSLVTRTRSLKDIQLVLSQTIDGSGNVTARTTGTFQDAFAVDVDTIVSPLVTSGPTTATVYAPVSVPAGTRFATLDTVRTQGESTTPIGTGTRTDNISGTYTMRFGNRFIITGTEDTVSGARTTRVIRQSVYLRGTTDPAATPVTNFVAAADTFFSNSVLTNGNTQAPVQFGVTVRSTSGSVKTYVDTIFRAGYVIAKSSGGATDPLYITFSTNALANTTLGYHSSFRVDSFQQGTGPYEGAPQFPGFIATMTSTNHARSITASVTTILAGSARFRWVLRGPGDTANVGLVTANGVVFSNDRSLMLKPAAGFMPGGSYRIRWQGDAFGPGVPFRYGSVTQIQNDLNASLAARPVAQRSVTDESIRSQFGFPGGAAGTRPIIEAKLPFQFFNHETSQPIDVVFLQRHATGNIVDSLFRNSRLFGTDGDTVRVQIPPDVWMPGDTLYTYENVVHDSTVTVDGLRVTVHRDTTINGRTQRLPIKVTRKLMTQFATFECASNSTPNRFTCNPLALNTLGATGYLPMEAGWDHVYVLNRNFGQNDEIQLTANALQASVNPLTKSDMENIFVVPNPYIVQSGYDRVGSNRATLDPRVLFVNVPTRGLLRVYSVSGQLMQQVSWTEADLVAQGSNSATGDLPFILRTREGLDFGAGLYLYVLTPSGANANKQVARGKFVIIR